MSVVRTRTRYRQRYAPVHPSMRRHINQCPHVRLDRNFNLELPREGLSILFQGLETRLLQEIQATAQGHFIFAAIAWLTSKPITNALIQAKRRGVIVLVLVKKEPWLRAGPSTTEFEKKNRRRYNCLGAYNAHAELEVLMSTFYNPGENWSFDPQILKPFSQTRRRRPASLVKDVAAVRCVGEYSQDEHLVGRMHHKFVVFGRKTQFHTAIKVWTGSYNFSSTAELSLENAVLIDNARVATQYAREFVMTFLHSEPLDWESVEMRPTFSCDPPLPEDVK